MLFCVPPLIKPTPMTELKPDERWSILYNANDFDTYIKICTPEIWLKPEVPKHIHDSFGIIRKLLEHSYYVYEFYDEAASKALLIFEMALKLRYEEIEGKKWKKWDNLQKLIQYFADGQYFEADNQDFFDHIRHVRNSHAHPEQFSFGGAIMKQWIDKPMGLINDLYEDRELRRQRYSKREQIVQYFESVLHSGAELIIGDRRYVLAGARLLFIDNKYNPEVYYFGFVPVFTLEERINGDLDDPLSWYPIHVIALRCKIDSSSNTLALIDQNNQGIIIRPLIDPEGKAQFSKWIEDYLVVGEVQVRFNSYMSYDLDPWFNALCSDFHRR